MADTFKPGDKVERSGIYLVVHDQYLAQEHEVTCVFEGCSSTTYDSGQPLIKCGHSH
jgi:hypothetical protein